VLRRSLGVSESAIAEPAIKPAPPVETEPIPQPDEGKPNIELPEELKGKVLILAQFIEFYSQSSR